MKVNKSHIVLKKAFSRMQKANAKFSVRALAKKLGVSHVFMMKVLKGQTPIPDKKIAAVMKALMLDELAQSQLKEAIIQDAIYDKLQAFPTTSTRKKTIEPTHFEEYPLKYLSVLNEWYDLPILDLLTCELPSKTPLALARNLGLQEHEVVVSLNKMKDLGLAEFKNGHWSKTESKIRFPMNIPNEVTKNYYKKVFKRASDELNATSAEQYARRSITNISIAVNPDKVQAAKEKLQVCLYEIATEMAEGDCTEVYFLTTCLIPLSK